MTSNGVEIEFDEKAKDYESNRLAPWYQAHAQEITQICPDNLHGDVLDIGCATGYQLRQLASRYPNSRLVGIDLSSKMIDAAISHSPSSSDQFHYYAANWENLDQNMHTALSEYNFKLIICANTFHYFTDPANAIKLAYEMLDTNGMLLVLEREKSNSVLTLFWGLLHRHLIKDQVEFYSAKEIMHLLKQAEFDNPTIVNTIRKYFWKGKLYTSLALIKGKK